MGSRGCKTRGTKSAAKRQAYHVRTPYDALEATRHYHEGDTLVASYANMLLASGNGPLLK